MKEEENLYNVLGVKQTIRANVVIVNGENYTELKDKEVEIYQGARGIKFYRIDNNLYPVRFFREGQGYQVQKKYKPAMAWLVPSAFVLWYLQTVYMFHLMTNENYFNTVTIITMVFLAGAIYFVIRTLNRQMVNVIYLVKNKFVWDYKTLEPDLAMRGMGRTITVYKGYSASAPFIAAIFGFLLAFIINMLLLRVKQLPLLTAAYDVNGWVKTNSETAEKIVNDFARTLNILNLFVYVIAGVGVFLLFLWFIGSILLMKNPKQNMDKLVFMGDLINYDPKEKKFELVDYYFNPFENPQEDVNTLHAATITEQEKLKEQIKNVRKRGQKVAVEIKDLVLKDMPLVEGITLENCREVIQKNYTELKQDYTSEIVKEIIDEQKKQLIILFEVANLLLGRADVLEADRDAKDKLFNEATKRLDEVNIAQESLEPEPKKKKLTVLEFVLLVFSGLMFVVFIILIIMLYNTTGGVPTT